MMMIISFSFLCLLPLVNGEAILRGQCSSFIQPEEHGITVDMDEFGFGIHVIREAMRQVNTSDECMSICLASKDPPCRSAVYQLRTGLCVPLRLNKRMAMDFDRSKMTPTTITGILISPQEISFGVNERSNGVANCDSFCPSPQQISADTVDPICVSDCSGTAQCAGEQAGCFDYTRTMQYQRDTFYFSYDTTGYGQHLFKVLMSFSFILISIF